MEHVPTVGGRIRNKELYTRKCRVTQICEPSLKRGAGQVFGLNWLLLCIGHTTEDSKNVLVLA